MPEQPFAFIPIIPKRPIHNINPAATVQVMTVFGLDLIQHMAKYPRSETAYRRSGRLGRSWTGDVHLRGTDLVAEVGNVVRYSRRVQGFESQDPRQIALFANLGWLSVEKGAEEKWEQHRPRIEAALQGPPL